jgi:hypothetical protein
MSAPPIDLRLGALPLPSEGSSWFLLVFVGIALPLLGLFGHPILACILSIPLLLMAVVYIWACLMCAVAWLLDEGMPVTAAAAAALIALWS